jgi:dienelactone hydrolase
MTALLSGRTLLGARVWDVMRLIDLLRVRFSDRCDTSKIYSMGNSGGGTATFYAAALDTRIAAAMPSCAFCTYADSIGGMYHCACNYVPRIRAYFDMAELAAMTAPRPLVIVSGAEDDIFPIAGAKAEFARLKEYYAAADAADKCVHVIGDAGHRFYADAAWPAFLKLTQGEIVC